MKKTVILLFLIIFLFSTSKATFWEQTNGPFGGDIGCLGIDREGNIYAGRFSGYSAMGIYKSTDNGDSWELINNELNVQCFAVDSTGRLLAGTFTGLYCSSDYGKSWSNLNLADGPVNCVLVSREGEIFVTSEADGAKKGDFYYSSDNGKVWESRSMGIAYGDYPRRIFETSKGTLILTASGVGGALYRSTDKGKRWVTLTRSKVSYYSIAEDSQGNIYIGKKEGNILKSTDDGITWEFITKIQETNDANVTFKKNVFEILPLNNGEIMYGTSGGVYFTDINGDNLEKSSLYSIVTDLKENRQGYIFASVRGRGVYRSIDKGKSWSLSNNGMKHTSIELLEIGSDGDIYAYTNRSYGHKNSGFFCSSDEGDTWKVIDISALDEEIYCIGFDSQGNVLAGMDDSGVYRSTDKGNSWKNIGLNGLRHKSVFDFYTEPGEYILAATDEGLYQTLNEGQDWELVENVLPEDKFRCIVSNPDGHLYAGSRECFYISEDAGNSWTKTDIDCYYVLDIAFNDEGDVFVLSNSSIYRSTDEGESWVIIRDEDGDLIRVNCIKIDCIGNIIAGGRNGVIVSTDNGDSWKFINDGLNNPAYIYEGISSPTVSELAISSNNRVFAGTSWAGIFRSTQPLVGVNQESGLKMSSVISLHPNPFSQSTIINYELREAGYISLELFDMLGNKIATLVDDWREAGRHNYELRISNYELGAGMYMVRMMSGEGVVTEKVVYVE